MTLIGIDFDEPADREVDRDGEPPPPPEPRYADGAATRRQGIASLAEKMLDGATFILDVPEGVPAVWGLGGDVLWPKGESLMITGGPGVGKTTVAAQVVRARIGLTSAVFGLPVEDTGGRVLYLAMDRPAQARRALNRLFLPAERDALAERLRFWLGPPPLDLARRTDVLLEMCQDAGADTVVVDSLKDAAIGLSEDEIGARYNRARQTCLAAGVEVLELHHPVKRGANGGPPTSLADLYGSTWIAAGAGSVIGLHGDPGDVLVEFRHLKQPMDEVGPWTLRHDHTTGTTTLQRKADLLELARASGSITAQVAAGAMFDTPKPTPNQVEKARYRLKTLVEAGDLHEPEKSSGSRALVYRPRDRSRLDVA